MERTLLYTAVLLLTALPLAAPADPPREDVRTRRQELELHVQEILTPPEKIPAKIQRDKEGLPVLLPHHRIWQNSATKASKLGERIGGSAWEQVLFYARLYDRISATQLHFRPLYAALQREDAAALTEMAKYHVYSWNIDAAQITDLEGRMRYEVGLANQRKLAEWKAWQAAVTRLESHVLRTAAAFASEAQRSETAAGELIIDRLIKAGVTAVTAQNIVATANLPH